MKIVFLGDSITEMGRNRELNKPSDIESYGSGFPIFVASNLYKKHPEKYEVINRGISGNHVAHLYSRVKQDVWNLAPDVLNILVGVNDVAHEINWKGGINITRFEKIYRNLIEETIQELPNIKIILCEPFMLKGSATENTEEIPDRYERFLQVYDYAKVVEKLAKEYNLYFLPLQEKFNEVAKKYGEKPFLFDGVHPMIAGATLIADAWTKLFEEQVEPNINK